MLTEAQQGWHHCPAGLSWSVTEVDRGPQGLTLNPGSFPSACAVSPGSLLSAAHLWSPECEGKQLFSLGKFMASPSFSLPLPHPNSVWFEFTVKTHPVKLLVCRRFCWPWCIHRRAANDRPSCLGFARPQKELLIILLWRQPGPSGSSQSGFRLQSYSPGTFLWVRSPQEQLSALGGLWTCGPSSQAPQSLCWGRGVGGRHFCP